MEQQHLSPEMRELKEKLKVTWESGDYGFFARYLEPGALDFFNRLPLAKDAYILDVACGAGQLLIPAAQRGLRAVGIDIAQNLVDQALKRAENERLDFEVLQGDAEALPFQDKTFDGVISLIGAMFAPQPDRVASEMLRVCKDGGLIAMGNWTPQGHIGQMFALIASYAPPPSIFPAPVLWGVEDVVRKRLGWGLAELTMQRRMYPFRYPFDPEKVAQFFVRYLGPAHRAYNSLDASRRPQFLSELSGLWARNNKATDGTTAVDAEYLEVIGIKKTA